MAQFNLTSEDTVPRSSTVSGTVTAFTTSPTVAGSGTSFLSDVQGGGCLVDLTNNQLREIDYVVSDTELVLKTPFSTALTGATVKFAKGGSREISIAAKGADITIQDSLGNTSTVYDGDSLTPRPDSRNRVLPILVQATTAATANCTTTP